MALSAVLRTVTVWSDPETPYLGVSRGSEMGAAAVSGPPVVDEAPLIAVRAVGDVFALEQVVREAQRGCAGFVEYAEMVVIEADVGGGQVLAQL